MSLCLAKVGIVASIHNVCYNLKSYKYLLMKGVCRLDMSSRFYVYHDIFKHVELLAKLFISYEVIKTTSIIVLLFREQMCVTHLKKTNN